MSETNVVTIGRRPDWVDELFVSHGVPKVCIDEPQKLHGESSGDFHRRVWVWFIDGRNHNITIDRYGSYWETAIHCPDGDVVLRTKERPSDTRCREALWVARWPAAKAVPDAS